MKINRLHKSVKSAFVYTFATVFSRGLAIITVPIFTRLMDTDQIGVVNLYNSWYSLISVVATLSLTSGGFAVAMKEFEGERNQYLSSVLSLTSIIGVFIGIVFSLFGDFWSNVTGLSKLLLCLMVVGFIVAPARDFWLARQRYEYKYKLAGCVTIFSAVIASMVSILAVLFASNGAHNISVAEYRLFGNYLIIYGIDTVIWVSILLKGRTFFRKKYWKLSLALSIPLVGYAVASQILSVSDRIMISKMVSDSAVGIYSTLYTVSSLSLMVWSAINASFVPYLYQNIGVHNEDIKKISFSLLALYSLVAIILVYLAPEIVKILATKEYYEAIYIMPPIAGGVYFTSVSNMFSNVLIYVKKTRYIMISACVAAALNVVTNYIFIQLFGYMAAAYTTLFGYIVMAIILFYFANKCSKASGASMDEYYANKQIGALSLLTTIFCLMGIVIYRFTILRYVIIALLAVAVLHFALIYQKRQEKN